MQVVEVEGEILEKPADAAQAKRMLTLLSNKSHQVHTGENSTVSLKDTPMRLTKSCFPRC